MKTATTTLLAALMLLSAVEAQAQIQAASVKLHWFRTNTSCPGVYDHSWDGIAEEPVTFQDFSLFDAQCQSQSNTNMKVNNWATTATADPKEDPSINFSFMPNTGYTVEFDGTFDKIRLKKASRSNSGPATCQFFHAKDAEPTMPLGVAFTMTTTKTTFNITVPAQTVNVGETMNFRLLCWDAANTSGSLKFEQISLLFDDLLPVELVTFEATADGDDIELRWETASELNNAGFFVELTPRDNLTFEQLGFVEGHGTTEVPQHYTYRIEGLPPGDYIFRLKQVDFDGTFEYSPDIEVLMGMQASHVVEGVFPNPFNPEAQFRFAINREQHVEVALYDMLGRQVLMLYTGRPTTGQMQVVHIDGHDLPSGLYLVRVVGETFAETQKVTLVK